MDTDSSPKTPDGQAGLVLAGAEIEAWLAVGLRRKAASRQIDLDLPLGMHLPILAGGSTALLTPRFVLTRTSHLGAPAYEAWLASQPNIDSLTAQAFLVQLGLDDTPGERPVDRAADLDVMMWLVQALGGSRPLEVVLAEWFDVKVQRAPSADTEASTSTPAIRAARMLLVPPAAHAAVLAEWKATPEASR